MATSVDLLIVGAGIYGATAAYAASRRGLSVALIDRGDLGGGASSNSMKVAHGGLRYLQSLDLRRSFESVRERRRLLRLAPGLVRPLPVRLDMTHASGAYRQLFHAGLIVNDLLFPHRNLGVAVSHRLPRSAYPRWHDARIDDTERLLLAFLHSARALSHGGLDLRPYTRVRTWIRRTPQGACAELDDQSRIDARAVLDCTGASRTGQRVVLGMNLVTDPLPGFQGEEAVGFEHADEGRYLFVVPWRGRSIVGTYYREYPFDPGEPLRFEPAWLDEVLAWCRAASPALAGLARSSVRLIHAGLMPRGSAAEPQPSERATLRAGPDGVVEVSGVKWTTAAGVSERAVDLAARAAGLRTSIPDSEQMLVDGLAERARYRSESTDLAAPLLPGRCELPRSALLFATDCEWARGLPDVLLRRTGLAAAGHPGRAVAEAAAALLQRHLGWSERETRDQLDAFHADSRFAGNVPA